ncbi:hypothetical protein D3C73_1282200 [compost metagenome]
MPVIIPGKGDRKALPIQHIFADCMSPCTAILMEEMIFSGKIDQTVRITHRTAHRRVMILRPVFFMIIAGSICNIGVLKISGPVVHYKPCVPVCV